MRTRSSSRFGEIANDRRFPDQPRLKLEMKRTVNITDIIEDSEAFILGLSEPLFSLELSFDTSGSLEPSSGTELEIDESLIYVVEASALFASNTMRPGMKVTFHIVYDRVEFSLFCNWRELLYMVCDKVLSSNLSNFYHSLLVFVLNLFAEKMNMVEEKGKKGLILKTWERCRSIGGGRKGIPYSTPMSRSKSRQHAGESPEEDKRILRHQVAPEGCFSVYVGPQRQRFVIKTDYINHPLFKMLLEEAELEYGYNSEGPLALPCDVDLFCKLLLEMDGDGNGQGCNFVKGYNSYRLLSTSRMVATNQF
ncbi:hypothetical protein HHK36_029373 [Tetracentron sinense]|uniref:Small auxin up regulated protein n=1 Tax=Tetracentron sinense TaxID=13715 RepID=A0A835CZP0_TETSI|nr:hypothetical protein HHK36_029373 [Tetracentron sinense]